MSRKRVEKIDAFEMAPPKIKEISSQLIAEERDNRYFLRLLEISEDSGKDTWYKFGLSRLWYCENASKWLPSKQHFYLSTSTFPEFYKAVCRLNSAVTTLKKKPAKTNGKRHTGSCAKAVVSRADFDDSDFDDYVCDDAEPATTATSTTVASPKSKRGRLGKRPKSSTDSLSDDFIDLAVIENCGEADTAKKTQDVDKSVGRKRAKKPKTDKEKRNDAESAD